MPDLSSPISTAQPPISSGRPRSRSLVVFGLLVAFLLGAALVAWASSRGYLARLLPNAEPAAAPLAEARRAVAPVPPNADEAAQLAAITTAEGRLALIEDRLGRIDSEAHAASGNAARAEGLLIAFSARRLVDRGQPLGYVADQLKLRFADAQPRSVQTVLAFAQKPVTLDELSARLEALSPELSVTGDQGLWTRVRREVSSLFVVRRDASALLTPSARIERARLMLIAGKLDSAIGEVSRLPGADAADTWIADARRYEAAQAALDLIETTAMLEPRRLRDAQGGTVDQPSPLAAPAPATTPVVDAPDEPAT